MDTVWPWNAKRSVKLADVKGPTEVDFVATIEATGDRQMASPISGVRAALFRIEIVERFGEGETGELPDRYVTVGSIVLGDMLSLRPKGQDASITLAIRRAQFSFAMPLSGGAPLTRVPSELMGIVKRASGRGSLCVREYPLSHGDEVRLRAFVEPVHSVVATGYRSGVTTGFVARDDLGPVLVEELGTEIPF